MSTKHWNRWCLTIPKSGLESALWWFRNQYVYNTEAIFIQCIKISLQQASSPRPCLLTVLTEITGTFPSITTLPHCGNWHISFQKTSRTFPEGKTEHASHKRREQNVIWFFNCYPMKQYFQNWGKMMSNLEIWTQLTPSWRWRANLDRMTGRPKPWGCCVV